MKGLLVSVFFLLVGCSGQMQSNQPITSEVGTTWGRDVHSSVTGISVERAEREPINIVLINYSTQYKSGYDRVYSIRINNLEYAVRDENFNSIPITRRYDHFIGQWKYFIQATAGTTYQLYVRNFSSDTNYEIVATVDGLDVLSGKPGSLDNSGYIINADDSLVIKGFRKNKNTEAAFLFSDASASYAANSAHGDVRNIGVIGFATFALQRKLTTVLPPCSVHAFPAESNIYAPPPCRK